MKKSLLLFCLVSSLLIALNKQSFATHCMGADIEYTCTGVNASGQTILSVTVVFYRDCGPAGSPSSTAPITITVAANSSCGSTTAVCTRTCPATIPGLTSCEVSPFCPAYYSQSCCHSNAPGCYPGVQKYVFTGTMTLPAACSNWILSYEICCRNTSITNLTSPGSRSMRIEAMVNSLDTICSSSPVFTNSAVPYICDGQLYNYNHGAVDPDGDSLYYELVDPLNTGGTPIPFVGGYTATLPLSVTGPFIFNNATGQMTFTPNGVQFAVIALKISKYRNGVLLGYVRRDIQIVVLAASLCNTSTPVIEVLDTIIGAAARDTVTVQVCPNTPMHLTIPVWDPGHTNLTLSSSIGGFPPPLPGATFGHYGSGDSLTAWISWTPTYLDTGCHYFSLSATNDACPYTSTSSRVFQICVDKQVVVNPDSATYCGTPVALHATGGAVYSWTNTAWLINPTSRDPLAQPPVSCWFTYSSECGADSAWVNSVPPFTMDAGIGDSICKNGQAFLSASASSTYAPYTYEWTPSAGLTNPTSGLPDNTIPNPVASPSTTTTYYCYFTASNGCERYDSTTVYITGFAPNVVAKVEPDSICPGDQVVLMAYTQPDACGTNGDTCTGPSNDYTLGTSATITGGSPTQYPTLYGNWNKSSRHQILYKASDLLPVFGGKGGKITSIAFDIGTFQTGASATGVLHSYTIKMKCTSTTSLDDWESGLTIVFDPKDVTPVSGWNTHILDHPYDWDGVSNIVVDICFYNPTTSALLNHKLRYTNAGYNCMLWTYNNTEECNTNVLIAGLATYRQQRFNTRFTVCQNNFSGAAIQWEPSTGANAPMNPLIDTTIAHPIDITLYTIDVDQAGCVGSSFVTVDVDTSIHLYMPDDISICDTSQTVTLTAIGASYTHDSSTFIHSWASIPFDPSLTSTHHHTITVHPAVTTTYYDTLTTGLCRLVDSVTVYCNFSSIPINSSATDVSCYGSSDGAIVVVPLAGNPPFSYHWAHTAVDTNALFGLAAGTYYLTFTDVTSCSGYDTITVREPIAMTLSLSHTDVPCNGMANGTITATPSGGCCTYYYSWSPAAASSGSLSGLNGGTYAVTVSDDNGCTVQDSVSIIEPPLLNLSVLTTDATIFGFNDGTASETISGGNPPYTQTWGPGAVNPDSLFAGTYWLLVTDSNGCTISDTFVITDPPPVVITYSVVHNPCFGDSLGSITITSVTGGIPPYTYSWSTTAAHPGDTLPSLNGLAAGTYTVHVRDSVGVTVNRNITVTQPTALLIQFDSTQPSCFGFNNGWLEANVSGGTALAGGGYSYLWNTIPAQTSQTAINLTAGSYSVTVTDSNNCTATATYTLYEPGLLVANILSTTDASCNGFNNGTATVSVGGGSPAYTYLWPTVGTATNSNLSAGFHTVSITDVNGCVATDTFTIYEPSPLVLILDSVNAHCSESNDGSASVTASGSNGGYSYNWNSVPVQTTSTATALTAPASYTVTVTDALGCSSSSSIFVDVEYDLTISLGSDSTTCFAGNDGSVWASPSNGNGAYSYNWSIPGSSADSARLNVSASSYSVTVTDLYGCTAQGNISVYQPSAVIATLSATNPSCSGMNDGLAWVQTSSGGNAPYSYSWSTIPPQTNDSAIQLTQGSYSLSITDANGCSSSASIILSDPFPLSINLLQLQNVSCYGYDNGLVEVSASGGTAPYSYIWSHGASGPLQNLLAAGSYTVTLSDANGCSTTNSFIITEPVALGINAIQSDSTSCPGENDGWLMVDAFGGSAPLMYSIDSLNFYYDPEFYSLSSGVYEIWVRDLNGCMAFGTVTIFEPQEMDVEIIPIDPSIELGASVQLTATYSPYPSSAIQSYHWSPDVGLNCTDCQSPVASPYNTVTYFLTVEYLNNCIATDSVRVIVGEPVDFYIPNAFTPNADGENDFFRVYGDGIRIAHMMVFDRWGEKVYETDWENRGWDGYFKGTLLSPGVYAYLVEVVYINGKRVSKSGSVTLMR